MRNPRLLDESWVKSIREGEDTPPRVTQDEESWRMVRPESPNKPTCYDSLLGTRGRVDRLQLSPLARSRKRVERGLLDVPFWCGHQLCPRAKMDTDGVESEGRSDSWLPAVQVGPRATLGSYSIQGCMDRAR